MVKHDKEPGVIDCLPLLRVVVHKEGEIDIDELEQVDDIMLDLGSQRTGNRTDVTTTESKYTTHIEYVYQERLLSKSVANAEERLAAFTDFDEPSIFIGSNMVEYK